MGFGDFLKQAAASAGSYAKGQLDSVQEYRERYEGYSDERLKKMFKESSGAKRMAIYQIMKDRGYHLVDNGD